MLLPNVGQININHHHHHSWALSESPAPAHSRRSTSCTGTRPLRPTPATCNHGTKEMMQPCLIYLHVISLVAPTSAAGALCDHPAVARTKETINPVQSTYLPSLLCLTHARPPPPPPASARMRPSSHSATALFIGIPSTRISTHGASPIAVWWLQGREGQPLRSLFWSGRQAQPQATGRWRGWQL